MQKDLDDKSFAEMTMTGRSCLTSYTPPDRFISERSHEMFGKAFGGFYLISHVFCRSLAFFGQDSQGHWGPGHHRDHEFGPWANGDTTTQALESHKEPHSQTARDSRFFFQDSYSKTYDVLGRTKTY